jgi:hypothetical protein
VLPRTVMSTAANRARGAGRWGGRRVIQGACTKMQGRTEVRPCIRTTVDGQSPFGRMTLSMT